MATKADSPTKTCTKDGCTKALRARGLCGTHYNQAHHPERHAKKLVACAYCGTQVLKASGGGRIVGAVCSDWCKGQLTRRIHIESRTTSTELVGPIAQTCIKAAEASPTPSVLTFHAGLCRWCGTGYVAIQRGTQDFPRACSARCSRSFNKRQQGHRKHWITKRDRHVIYERDQWTCQLCMCAVDQTLPVNDIWSATLDHIIPQSKQLIPDDQPSNLRLAHRWCNSVRGDDTYYTVSDLMPTA